MSTKMWGNNLFLYFIGNIMNMFEWDLYLSLSSLENRWLDLPRHHISLYNLEDCLDHKDIWLFLNCSFIILHYNFQFFPSKQSYVHLLDVFVIYRLFSHYMDTCTTQNNHKNTVSHTQKHTYTYIFHLYI